MKKMIAAVALAVTMAVGAAAPAESHVLTGDRCRTALWGKDGSDNDIAAEKVRLANKLGVSVYTISWGWGTAGRNGDHYVAQPVWFRYGYYLEIRQVFACWFPTSTSWSVYDKLVIDAATLP